MKSRIILIVLLFLQILCSCNLDTPTTQSTQTTAPTQPSSSAAPGLKYTPVDRLVISEPFGASMVKKGFQTSYKDVTYTFISTIPETQRESFIQTTAIILHRIQRQFGSLSKAYHIIVLDGLYYPRIVDETLYIGIDMVEHFDLAIGLSQLYFGTDTNYGILYGLAVEIAQDLGFPVSLPNHSLNAALSLCDEAPFFLDMNYACFLQSYSNEPTVDKLKVLAYDFYKFLKSSSKCELFIEYSDKKYCQYLSEYLALNGKGPYDNSDLGETHFYYSSPELLLTFENEYAKFYVENNFKPAFESGIFVENMLSGSYANLRQWVCDSVAQASYIEEKLGTYDTAPQERVNIVFKNKNNPGSMYEYYQEDYHCYSQDSFLAIYTRYLIRNTQPEDFMYIALFNYFRYKPVSPQVTYLWYADKQNVEDPDSQDAHFWQAIQQHIGHPFDWLNPDDYFYQVNAYMVYWDYLDADVTKVYRGGNTMSFFYYLVSNYGEALAVQTALCNTPKETLGKDWDRLITDWRTYVASNFSWVEDYKTA